MVGDFAVVRKFDISAKLRELEMLENNYWSVHATVVDLKQKGACQAYLNVYINSLRELSNMIFKLREQTSPLRSALGY